VTPLIEAGLALLLVAIYSVACMFGGYEFAQSRAAKQQATLEAKATTNTQTLATANAVAAAPIIKYIDRIQTVTRTITKEIPLVQTITLPALCPEHPAVVCPAAITAADRLLIDSAARGIDPSPRPSVDGSPYPAGSLTASVVANYGRCNSYIAQLKGLQDYVHRTIEGQKLLCPKP
jgi:hypothetical protein